MLLVNLVAMIPTILFSGWLCDRPNFPRVTMALCVYAAMAALSVPMFLLFRNSWTACWLLQLVTMLLLSMVLGERVGGCVGVVVAGEAVTLPACALLVVV